MQNDDILNNLKIKLKDLTNSERKVADFIIKNPSETTYDTINVLSKKAGTSTTTVMRLATKLDYSGYAELQQALQEYMKNNSAPKERLISNLQNVEENELWSQTIGFYANQMDQLFKQIDKTTLDEAVNLIEKSKRVYCTSVRSGLSVGQYLSQNINRLHGNCKFIVADVSDWVDEIVSMGSDDLLVAVSFPRYAKRINDFVKIAKEKNVRIIVITDKYSSPLVDYSDIVLPADSNSLAFHNSPIPAMIMVDYIINSLAIKNSKKESDRLDEVNNILKRINYHTGK